MIRSRKKGELFSIHKYKHSHNDLRLLYRKMLRLKHVKVINHMKDTITYIHLVDQLSNKEIKILHADYIKKRGESNGNN